MIPALDIESPLDGAQGFGVGVEQRCNDLEGAGSIVVTDGQLKATRIRRRRRSVTNESERDLHLDQPLGQGFEVGGRSAGVDCALPLREPIGGCFRRLAHARGGVGGRRPRRHHAPLPVIVTGLQLSAAIGATLDFRPVFLAAPATHFESQQHVERMIPWGTFR
ncbi:MAG TPA: hypothetical protein VKI41_02825 [Vicinamibacteria bacterium]|nr:hypothetical protein [Vicinamibacteria bacterium]